MSYDEAYEAFRKLAEQLPKAVIVTATQPPRPEGYQYWPITKNRCDSGPDIVIIDHMSLLKP
jgi:hypothetical protein